MNNKENEGFKLTYSAREQEEIKGILKKYSPPLQEGDKMERLRRLDGSATRKATVWAVIVGVFGTLMLGCGMSLAMSEFEKILGAYSDHAMLVGVLVGGIGILLMCCAYPIYYRILKKQRKKIAPEIIMLADELIKH